MVKLGKTGIKKNFWVCEAMRTLFSKDEILEGYVYGEKSKSKFKRLDPERIELLKQALFIKYPDTNEIEWKNLKGVAGHFCIDKRKKLNKKAQKSNDLSNKSKENI